MLQAGDGGKDWSEDRGTSGGWKKEGLDEMVWLPAKWRRYFVQDADDGAWITGRVLRCSRRWRPARRRGGGGDGGRRLRRLPLPEFAGVRVAFSGGAGGRWWGLVWNRWEAVWRGNRFRLRVRWCRRELRWW